MMLTFEEFEKELLTSGLITTNDCICQKHSKKVSIKKPITTRHTGYCSVTKKLSISWIAGGMSGGNCYGNVPSRITVEDEPEFDGLDNILEKYYPQITLLEYKRFTRNNIETHEETDYGYYGNSTLVKYKYFDLQILYKLIYNIKDMKHIVILVGLPGSGKTFHGKNSYKDYKFIDDCETAEYLIANLQEPNIVVTSPWYVCKEKLEYLKEALLKYGKDNNCNMNIDCIYFENNPDQCLQNVKYRNDGRKVNNFIKTYSKVYHIPEGITPIRIFDTKTLDK